MSHSIKHQVNSFQKAQNAPLGTNTKSSSPSPTAQKRNLEKNQGFRSERYALQNVIRSRFIAESEFDGDNPDWEVFNSLPRVVKCKRTRVAPTVGLYLDQVAIKAHYTGLNACGSVWTCPICCAQVQEVRRQEIVQAFDWSYQEGHKIMMVTFTIPHYQFQACADLLDRLAQAFKYLRSGKRYQNFKKEIGYCGNIRSLEVKYGGNGWHPHTHELFIVRPDMDPDQVRAYLVDRWEAACKKVGLIPRGKLRAFRAHAIDVMDNVSSSDYLAKDDDIGNTRWGGDRELTSWMLKESGESMHPFQLAAAAGNGDRMAWRLFAEYASAFKGRAALFWSKGLKDKVGVNQETDEEIADKDNQDNQEEYQEVAHLETHAWNQVVSEGARSKLLDIAERTGQPGVDQWLRVRGLHSVPAWFKDVVFTDLETVLPFALQDRRD